MAFMKTSVGLTKAKTVNETASVIWYDRGSNQESVTEVS